MEYEGLDRTEDSGMKKSLDTVQKTVIEAYKWLDSLGLTFDEKTKITVASQMATAAVLYHEISDKNIQVDVIGIADPVVVEVTGIDNAISIENASNEAFIVREE